MDSLEYMTCKELLKELETQLIIQSAQFSDVRQDNIEALKKELLRRIKL